MNINILRELWLWHHQWNDLRLDKCHIFDHRVHYSFEEARHSIIHSYRMDVHLPKADRVESYFSRVPYFLYIELLIAKTYTIANLDYNMVDKNILMIFKESCVFDLENGAFKILDRDSFPDSQRALNGWTSDIARSIIGDTVREYLNSEYLNI